MYYFQWYGTPITFVYIICSRVVFYKIYANMVEYNKSETKKSDSTMQTNVINA